MTYRKRPEKYDIIWARKLRHKYKKLRSAAARQAIESQEWRYRHLRKRNTDFGSCEWYFEWRKLYDSQKLLQRRYQKMKQRMWGKGIKCKF